MPEFDVAGFIRQLEASGPPADPRRGLDTESLVSADPTLSSVEITEVNVVGPHGDVPVRLYSDPSRAGTTALVWIHGGGFVGGDLDMPEAHWVSLVIASRGIPVASVDYRKALRGVRYPVQLDEVIAAWQWVTGAAQPLGAQVTGFHLGGASAGANLATAATQRLRDEGRPMPRSLVLAYPLLHTELPPLSEGLTAALASNPPPVNFTPTVVEAFNANYVGDAAASSRYAFPGDIELHDLPPVRIVNAEADEMRASGELFARQLAAVGVDVECVTQTGAQHGFLDEPNHPGAVDAIEGWLAFLNEVR
ncbi:alpha/beta hydrolase fold domain-containing protein [Microbacterium sp. 2FI]|uniref:alpha/beta hydrolase fold domain-containing protein n=1 Tax=Microbacterium sp. 2FI TaxID=2502193 RepID=UPI0010F6171C|nr:alpha/beta hydrolase fold domain-containing protein [Microbacterium sp. 2FI]